MKTRLRATRGARSVALRLALAVGVAAFGANAQPAPSTSPPPTPAPGTGAPPPSTEPPPPLATSPLLDDQSQPPPPAPTYQNTEPTPTEEPPPPPPTDEERPRGPAAGPFARGGIRLSFLVGSGFTRTDDYVILGLGAGYYVLDGLELGLDYEVWLGGDPVFHRLSPGVKYVFYQVPVIKPYVGGFYRHTFVNGSEDYNYLGARGGIYIAPKPRGVYFGGGAVYEHRLSCTASAYIECDDVYPEVFVGVSL